MDYLTTKNDGFRGATPYDLVDKILWFENDGDLSWSWSKKLDYPSGFLFPKFLDVSCLANKITHCWSPKKPSGNQTLQ